MPNFRRLVVPGLPHHVTQRGVRRQTTFFDSQDYKEYLRIAVGLMHDAELDFWAYCLMPNHIHAIVVPNSPQALSTFFAQLHRRYARKTNIKHDWQGHLWQQRFYSVVMDESHTLAAIRYVERNPVRAELCRYSHDWPWSSARAHLGLSDDPLINPATNKLEIQDWKRYLEGTEDPCQLKDIRSQTRTGRPTGGNAFLRELEQISGRQVFRRKPGRKKKIG